MGRRVAHHPFQAIRCPYTNDCLHVREHRDENGDWKWAWKNRDYNNLDEVIEARARKFAKEVDHGQ